MHFFDKETKQNISEKRSPGNWLQFEYWKRFEAIEYRLENLENISIEDERKIFQN
jgi:hypothetical protein